MIILDKRNNNIISLVKQQKIKSLTLLLLTLILSFLLLEKPLLSTKKQLSESSQQILNNLDWIFINIKKKQFDQLSKYRNTALANGHLTEAERGTVKAIINFKDQEYAAKIRLKGDLTDHIETDKWSFRIKLNGNQRIYGMKEFSVQRPETKGLFTEIVFLKILESEKLLSHKFDLIGGVVNGKNKGLYIIEEHFGTALLERQGYREGPILKFDENLWWNAKRGNTFNILNPVIGVGDFYSQNYQIFAKNKFLKDPKLNDIQKSAKKLFRKYWDGKLTTDQVFEADKLAKFIALSDLFGAHHGLSANQYRFYYNPINSKFEPIAFDSAAGISIKKIAGAIHKGDLEDWEGGINALPLSRFWQDRKFLDLYLKYLDKYSQTGWLEAKKKTIQNDLVDKWKIFKEFYPGYQFPWEIIFENRALILRYLNEVSPLRAEVLTKGTNNHQMFLQIANLHPLPVQVLGISDSTSREKLDLYLEARPAGIPLKYLKRKLKNQYDPLSTKIEYRIISNRKPSQMLVAHTKEVDFKKLPSLVDSFLKNPDIIVKQNTISFASKKALIDQDLIIPKNYVVRIAAGTIIDIVKKAKIISYSPFQVFGEKELPVIFKSSDRSGEGLSVFNAGESVFNHVIFQNLSNPVVEEPFWSLSGAVNFYESPVIFKNCLFKENLRGDDLVNIIRSKFSISNTRFYKSNLDALDVDFGEGKINNTVFQSSGNDACDFSGSDISLKDIEIFNTSDKALSAGENSRVIAENLKVNTAKIAIAAKDLSQVKLDQADIRNAEYGVIAFQKKPEYGPAWIEIDQLNYHNNSQNYLIEQGSSLQVDSKKMPVRGYDLRTRFY